MIKLNKDNKKISQVMIAIGIWIDSYLNARYINQVNFDLDRPDK